MIWMARDNGFRVAGMPMDTDMQIGMGLIVVGLAVAALGLLPRSVRLEPTHSHIHASIPDDIKLSWPHFQLMIVLTIAIVVDVMKPASLGFVLPGMIDEYGVPRSVAAWVPFAALCGTVFGSVVWGWLADLFGRRASILLSAVMYIGTAICGAMPSLVWNVVMCFMMGAAAGGMLPVAYALLTETVPSRHRGWALVLVGGLGAVGGYVAASGMSSWLQPMFGWRVMWFLNLPTGLILVLMNDWIPESAEFLLKVGRLEEARAVLRRFGCVLETVDTRAPEFEPRSSLPPDEPQSQLVLRTLALSVTAVTWGLVNFGLLLWLPANLVSRGYGIGPVSAVLAESALIALPTIFVAALLYSRWSTRGTLACSIAIAALGLGGLLQIEFGGVIAFNPVVPVTLLVIGINGMISVLLPYAAESYPLAIRARGTGWIAACTKFGGLIAQGIGVLGFIPGLGFFSMLMLAFLLLAIVLVLRFCVETVGDQGKRRFAL
jgi:putative MFS transporter